MQAGNPVSGKIHHVAVILQVIAQVGGNIRVVFNNQNAHWLGPVNTI
jgi:hypothetical protein